MTNSQNEGVDAQGVDVRGDGAQPHMALNIIAREIGLMVLNFARSAVSTIASISAMSEAELDLTLAIRMMT